MLSEKQLAPYLWAKNEWLSNIKEVTGKENNPRIVWYHAFTTLKATDDETPWCSAFMNAAAFSCGFQSKRSAAAISWKDFGIEGTGETGDIVVIQRKGGYHVAFLHDTYRPGDKNMLLLGGNQSNKVGVSHFKAEGIIAIRRFPG